MKNIVDWSKPIIAVPTPKGLAKGVGRISVQIDRTYQREPNSVPVRFPVNLWATGYNRPGTWYFTDDGESVGGRNEASGQDAMWSVRNGDI